MNRRPSLGYPLTPAPRVAVLGFEFERSPGVHSLIEWDAPRLAQIRPQALAAAFPDFIRVAELLRRGALALPELRYPLVVFSQPGEGALSLRHHDELWGWFGLPCFEQIRERDGRLLAHECEARDGFHLTAEARAGGLEGWPMEAPCECGLATPRMRIAPARVLAARTAG